MWLYRSIPKLASLHSESTTTPKSVKIPKSIRTPESVHLHILSHAIKNTANQKAGKLVHITFHKMSFVQLCFPTIMCDHHSLFPHQKMLIILHQANR